MKRILLYSVLTLILALSLWQMTTGQGLNYVTLYLLQIRSWTFTALQTFSGGLAVSGNSATVDLGHDYTMTDPSAPTALAGPTTGGMCSSANTYRLYVSWQNKSGRSNTSAASSDFTPSSGTTNKITVTRPSIHAEASEWDSWFSSSADAHATKKGCALISESNTAAGTTTFDCQCRVGNLTTAPTANDTNRISGLKIMTDYQTRVNLTVKEVCTESCEFSTIGAALTAITDASDSNRYLIFVRAPYSDTTTITMKSYVTLRGESRETVKVGEIDIPAGADEISITEINPIANQPIRVLGAGTGRIYISNLTCGSAVPTQADCVVNLSGVGGWKFYVSNVLIRTAVDAANLGSNDTWYGTGNTYLLSPASGNFARAWADGSSSAPGVQFYEQDPLVIVTVPSGNEQLVTGLALQNIVNTGATQGSRALISGGTIYIVNNNATRTADLQCVRLEAAGTNSAASMVTLIGTQCIIESASSTGALYGMNILADADHSNWTTRWIGGRIVLSGGATRADVNNAETVGGFSFAMNGVENSGSYSGAGTISAADARLGAFTTRLLGRVGDLVAATCTNNEIALDTGGANKEICICTGGAWSCSTVTTATGPTD